MKRIPQPITRSIERDNYILAQALHVAAREMSKEMYPEVSNIHDMRLILQTLYPGFAQLFAEQDRIKNEYFATHAPANDGGGDAA